MVADDGDDRAVDSDGDERVNELGVRAGHSGGTRDRFATKKPDSAPLSQEESTPVTLASVSSAAVPAIESPEIDLSDFVKTIIVDEEVGSEERENKKAQVPALAISDGLKMNSAETERIDVNQSHREFQESPWSFERDEMFSIGVEEVFDILPLYGVLRPHSSHQISFTFYGHCDIIAQAKALCEVEGGPTYEIILTGEASLVNYSFDTKDINYGLQLFDHVTESEITLKNTGKVGFEFRVLTDPQSSPDTLLPGVPLIQPLSMEVERLIVQDYAIEHQKSVVPGSTDDFYHRSRRKPIKVQLPEYILDFGYIILGDVQTHIIKITNTSHFPVSFHAEKRVLHDTGFSIELDRVKNLPYCETETFEVRFDTQGGNVSVGNKQVILPIKVVGGPPVHIRLQAKVTIPSMTLSSGKVEFATIQCGQCLVETIQLFNHLQVPCEWFVQSHKQVVSKLEKHMPKYLRRKLCAELKPKTRIFEIQPTCGVLDPGERSNVQVKFMPKEEKFYSQTLVFRIAQSAQKLTLLAEGQGLEPRLEFSPSVLELGPLLPYAAGDEAEVVVKNPCSFPIEFYSLEFDQQYLVEEKILRTLKGYDSYNSLLLPPRLPGEKLPPEVFEYFREIKRSKEEQMKVKYLESLAQENEEDDGPLSEQGTSASTKRTSLSRGISVTSNLEERHIPMVESKTYPEEEEDEESLEKIMFQTDKIQSIDSHSAEEVGEVENNPVSKAIARYLGIDISAEGRMAKNRKGIAIIIHGTPLSGKSATAVNMARYYSAACLNLDSIMLEAISDGNNIAGIRARELCIRAAIEQSMKEEESGDTGLVSCVFPEELFTQILADRIQPSSVSDPGCLLAEATLTLRTSEQKLSDCYRGVVFDSLETLFARNAATALLCLLKAIGNREHIYVINMAQDYAAMKAPEKAKNEQEEHKRREAQKREKERLQNMDEEEYDALTEEEKITFNREVQQALRERKRRELERLAKEMQEKKLQQELERQKEEDELKRKNKKPKQGPVKEEPSTKKTQIPSRQEQEDSEGDLPKDTDKNMAQKFKTFELTLKDIQSILTYWDRKQGVLLHHIGAEDMSHEEGTDQRQVPSGGRRGRKDRERERAEKERAERERLERERAEKERLEKLRAQEERSDGGEGEEEDHEGKKDLGVPFISIQTPDSEGSSWKQALENERLPKGEQILDILGLGSSGPPIPPPALFSIISYPVKRQPLTMTEILKHFVFVTPPSEELSLMEEKREVEAETEFSATPGSSKDDCLRPCAHFQFKTQEEQTTSSKGSKQKTKEKEKEKTDQLRETQKEKRRMAFNRKGLSAGTSGTVAPLSDIEQNNLSGQHSQEKFTRLNHFRWIVPANGEVTLRVHFSSNDLGIFDQTFNFEILGTHRQYQLYCRGVCTYPYICQDPKVVFPQQKMDMKANEVIFKKYIVSLERFHFGPLLCGKSRDKYKSSLFPGNMETLTILNSSPMVVEAFFCFQNDIKANTYFLEPINMILKPNEKQLLNVWAYPTAVGVFEDSIVCCIKENPEPAVFKLSCQGVRPELELDPRQLHFDRLLLHRKDSKAVLLRNITLLPLAWRITSLEHLGEDFAVSAMQGTIAPKSEYSLQVHFLPSKPVNVKKAIRLEVLDADNLVGVVQIENILIFAESYDVALDITFPKGAEGGLDLGIVKVMDEVKQPLQLKNRGKYEIMFSFSVESIGISATNISSMITVQPKKGSLTMTEKPTNVQVIFHAKKEVKIENQPVLRCQIIEPNISEGGEMIASIPIKFSVTAVFSKYNISPSSIINFGALIYGTRKSAFFTIENLGVIDFKYALYRMTGESPLHQKKVATHVRYARSRESENFYKTGPSKTTKFSDSVQKDVNITSQARFTHGMFTVYPGFGTIPSGGTQVITVDCVADPVGRCEEFIAIDISDRDPRDQPAGIPYSLLAEACQPAFVTDNNSLIFEEHQLCSSANLNSILQTVESGGLYVEDENKFIFCSVLVGHQAKARFKICNVGKIACDVNIVVKPISNKVYARITDIFEVEPNKMCVASRSHAFATVSFTPQTMQTYQCIFEATLDGLPSNLTKNRSLVFDIVGEGNLPRVTIVRPVLYNQYRNPLLLFKRLLLGHSETLPLILKNSGAIPAKLHVDLQDQLGVFSLKGKPSTSYIYITEENKPQAKAKKAHTASLVVPPGEIAGFDVVFHPKKVGRMAGILHLSVINNQYEDTVIHMVGEGYEDDITLDNIHGLVASSSPESSDVSEVIEESTMEDLVSAALVNHIQFGDCHIGTSYNVSFTITNHSQANVIRFEWPLLATVSFSPQMGHLHPGCAKDIVVTMKSDVPINLKKMGVKCKISKIMFALPADQVPDWDDRMRTVKWVDVPRNTPGTFTTKRKEMCNWNSTGSQKRQQKLSALPCETIKVNEVTGFSQRDQLSQGTPHTASTVDSAVDHWNETSLPPFCVEPISGTVLVGKTQKLKVKFSPLEVGDFESNLFCQTFTILNPTCSAYSFSWLSEEIESLQNPPAFTCLTEKGLILPEKKAEVIFQFTPSHLDISEAFWTFLIPEHNITVPFLLVGKATDPLINFDKSHINLSCLLIGREARETVKIINKEEQEFHFAFQDTSRYSEGFSNSLVVCPMEGWVPPLSRFPIDIFFTPKKEGDVNFNLICNVKKKAHPLTLNVKAEGYSVNVEVKCKDRNGSITLLTPSQTTTVNFYEVELNEYVQCEFSFINTGKFNFSFQAELSGPRSLLQYLEFSPIDGSVDISHGPTFTCTISGFAVSPAVHFSFTSYNFGTCFIYQAGMPPYKQTLLVTNKEETAMSLDCLYTNTSHLEVNFRVDVIKPGKTLEIPITFYPRETISYRELIPFEINGLSQQVVEIKGKGTEMKILVLDPANKILKLGAILPGQVVKKMVSIMNNSQAQLTFNLSVMFSAELQETKVITLSPFRNITMKPKEVRKLEVTFAPLKRVPPFSEEVFMECMGLLRPLFLISGCCQALEISLDQDHLPFGPVVCQTQATRRILMLNTGDVGARFKWDARKLEPPFSISPEEGYITAGMEVSFEVTYHPTEGTLFFPLPDGTGWLYQLHGTSELPKAVANIYREVPCKTPYTELLPVTNWLNKPQRFRVIVEMLKPEKLDLSVTLKGLDYIDVLSSSKKDYKLNFFSYKEGLYTAKVIFRNEVTNEFLYYTLSFRVIPSGVIKTIEMVSPVRQSTSASIKVDNPLPYMVTFSTECRVPDISLPSQFVVPANSEGTFIFEFQPLKAGETFGKLTLHNSDLGYYPYELNLKALPALPEKPVHFQTVLGSGQSIFAKFTNYTRQKTEYYCRTDCPDFHTEKVIYAAPGAQGGTEVSVEVYFEPSRLGESKGNLSLLSLAGGEYTIPLFGVALPPKPQGPFLVRAGYSIVIPFKNVFYRPVTFSFNVENAAFSIRAMDSVKPKKVNNITVYFEGNPSGSKTPITSKLIVTCPPGEGSDTGIKWVYYLKGITP
ncbi:hypothetical protein Celaphus_00004320 [Cervus elaphus hippelaphus]|uniref:Uncharacterized protein n=1 Tax=Cervus elaphus hippelaphus TaxID=46360 RepID=A0A212DDA5_CEREH|nr:hypothetical protein Celaphus_00004320 [Cervus elaphus hippelaphus]